MNNCACMKCESHEKEKNVQDDWKEALEIIKKIPYIHENPIPKQFIELTKEEFEHFLPITLPPAWSLFSFQDRVDPLGPVNDENRCIRYQLIKYRFSLHTGERSATFVG